MSQATRGELVDNEVGPDRRSGERQRVIFRTAKLLLEDHDCFCIMRDISSSGMKLQLFGSIDGIDTVDIEFPGGHVVRMHKRWARDGFGGFEFEQKIDIASVIALPSTEFDRRAQRLRMDLPAAVESGNEIIQVRLLDISLAGAKIAIDQHMRTYSELRIAIDGLGRKKADVCWYREGLAGIQFRAPLAFNELAAWSALLPARPAVTTAQGNGLLERAHLG